MEWEDLHSKLNKNESEDAYFIPSDKVWRDIKSDLDGKSRKRKWFLLFPLFGLFVAAGIFFFDNTNTGAQYGEEDFQMSSTTIGNEMKAKNTTSGDNNLETSYTKPTFVSESKKLTSLVSDNPTRTNSLTDEIKDKNTSGTIVNRYVVQDQSQNSTLSDFEFGEDLYSHHSHINGGTDEKELLDKKNIGNGFLSTSISNDNETTKLAGANSVRNGGGDVRDVISFEKLIAQQKTLSFQREDIDLSDKMVLVDIKNPINRKPVIVSVLGYTSASDYNINNFSGFGTLEFDLQTNISYGYTFEIEKYFTNRIFISAGFGVDHSHFNANYNFEVSENDILSSFQQNGQSITNISKQIPSLAGNLTSTFEINTFQNLQTNNYSLNLGHDYKTIYIPVSIGYQIIDQVKFDWTIAVQTDFSRRLLSIDTGINSISSKDPSESIELTGFSGNETEVNPFTIYNIYVGPKTELLYSLSNKLKAGIHISYSKPLSSIYSDANFSVDRQIFRSGVKVTLSL